MLYPKPSSCWVTLYKTSEGTHIIYHIVSTKFSDKNKDLLVRGSLLCVIDANNRVVMY